MELNLFSANHELLYLGMNVLSGLTKAQFGGGGNRESYEYR